MKRLNQANKQNVKGGNSDYACIGFFFEPEVLRRLQRKSTLSQRAKAKIKQENHINIWIYATALDFR